MRVDDIDQLLADGLNNRLYLGFALGIEREGRAVYRKYGGWSSPNREEVSSDSWFDLASVTKPFSTAVMVLRAADQGLLELDDPLGNFLPEINRLSGQLTIRQLLTHSSGLPAVAGIHKLFADSVQASKKRAIEHLLRLEPCYTPGSQVVYSCAGFLLLGLVLESLYQKNIAQLFEQLVAQYHVKGIGFLPSMKKDCVCSEYCQWRHRLLRGEVHDEDAWCMGGYAGNAGLFATLEGLSRWSAFLDQHGQLNGQTLLSEGSFQLLTSNQTPRMKLARSCGMMVWTSGSPYGSRVSPRSAGHTGYTGTSLCYDPERRLSIIFLTNQVYYGRSSSVKKAFFRLRQALHDMVVAHFGA